MHPQLDSHKNKFQFLYTGWIHRATDCKFCHQEAPLASVANCNCHQVVQLVQNLVHLKVAPLALFPKQPLHIVDTGHPHIYLIQSHFRSHLFFNQIKFSFFGLHQYCCPFLVGGRSFCPFWCFWRFWCFWCLRSRKCDWISTRLEFWSQPKWWRNPRQNYNWLELLMISHHRWMSWKIKNEPKAKTKLMNKQMHFGGQYGLEKYKNKFSTQPKTWKI